MELFCQVEIVFIALLSLAMNTYSFMSVSGIRQQKRWAFVDVPEKITVLSVTALLDISQIKVSLFLRSFKF